MTYSVTCLGDRLNYSLEGSTLRLASARSEPVVIDLHTEGIKTKEKLLLSAWFKISIAWILCGSLGLGVPAAKTGTLLPGGTIWEWVLLGALLTGVVMAFTIGRLWRGQSFTLPEGTGIVVIRDPNAGDCYEAFVAEVRQTLRSLHSGAQPLGNI